MVLFKLWTRYSLFFSQSQAIDPDSFLNQDSNLMMDQKASLYSHAYATQGQMPQNSYAQMPDPNFHPMGQRPNYGMLRMQTRPQMRPTGMVQNQPNQLRLQLQHRLQAQQVHFCDKIFTITCFHWSVRNCDKHIHLWLKAAGSLILNISVL